MNDPKKIPIRTRCGFAHPGTYGHECGAPAVEAFVFPSELTRDGQYFTGRCEKCAKIRGGENAGLIRREPLGNQFNLLK